MNHSDYSKFDGLLEPLPEKLTSVFDTMTKEEYQSWREHANKAIYDGLMEPLRDKLEYREIERP